MKTKLLIAMLAFGSMTFTSCTRCCEGGGAKICKKDTAYTDAQWKEIVKECRESPDCKCGA